PSMTESFLIALVAFVDTMMVSTLGDYAISAVGLTTQPKMLLFSFFMALSIAVSALVARRKGEGDQVSANKVMKNALIIALAAVVVISVSGCVFADSIIKFAGSQSDTHEYAVAYFRIIIAFMFFNVISMTINAAQRGVGNTKIAMRTNIVSNLVNVCFNYLLIGGNLGFPKLGVSGAAIATVIGAGCACAMSLRSVLVSGGYLCLKMKTGLKDPKSLRSMASIGASAFAEQVFLRFGFFVYAIIIASLGTEAFATQQIGANVLNISFSFGDGLSVAAVALVGRSLGEKRIDLAAIYGGFCQRCGLICSAVLSLVYVIFGRSIVELFSDSPEVIEKGTLIMYMMTVIVMF
ncbi:MAG: MATE family efflux transporter, partial [Oscillospiraceae bacterium]